MYDNAEYMNLSYPPNLTPQEQLEHVTERAKVFLLSTDYRCIDRSDCFATVALSLCDADV